MENKMQFSFERYEKKYLLTAAQQKFLLEAMQPYVQPDRYSSYTICNIYYDTAATGYRRRRTVCLWS